MNLPEFLTEHAYGSIRLTGHRIGLFHLVRAYKEGRTAEQLVELYPSLPLDLVQKAIDFYDANRAEVDAYVARCEEEIAHHMAATPPGPSTEELQRRWEALRQAQRA